MKWLIIIGIVIISYSSLSFNHFNYNQEKQQGRKLYFNKYRTNYTHQYLNIRELYNISKNKNNSEQFLSSSWKSLGPTDFNSEQTLNNGYGRINSLVINPLDSNELWAASAGGGLWIYSIRDSTWHIQTDTDFMSIGISSIAFSTTNPDYVYLATGDARGGELFRGYSIGILKSTDNGKNFSMISPIKTDEMIFIKKIIVSRTDKNILYVCSNKGLYYYNSRTDSSRLLIDDDYISDIEFHPLKPNIVYVSTANKGTNFIYKSIDSGKSFERTYQIYNSNRVELATTESQADYLFVLADGINQDTTSQLFISRDSGNSFKSLLDQNSSKKLIERQGSYNLTIFVHPSNYDLLFVGGVPLFRSLDGGESWTDISADLHVDQHDIIMSNDGTMYLANDGGVYRSFNYGNTWDNISTGLNITQFYCVSGHTIHPELVYAGAQDNGLMRLVPENNFHILTGDATGIQVDIERPNRIFAVLNNGQLFYSNNYGETFEGTNITNGIQENRTWISPLHLDSQSNRIIIGFSNLWESQNLGKSWSPLTNFDSLNNDFITSFALISQSQIIITKGNKIFLKSTDSLSHIASFPELISSCFYYNDAVYITFGAFDDTLKVIKLNKDLEIENLTYNLPNVPISKIILNTFDSCLYIASDIGVYRLNKSSSNWIHLTNNIGSPIVNDISFNQTTGKMYAATFGKGIWELDFNSCNYVDIKLNVDNDFFVCENTNYKIEALNTNDRELMWSDGIYSKYNYTNEKQIYFSYYIDSLNCIHCSNIVRLNHFKTSNIKLIALSKNPQCKGEPIYITAITESLDSCKILWSNGFIGDTIKLENAGDYFAVSLNKYGCYDTSDIFRIYYSDYPPKPLFSYQNHTFKIVNDNEDLKGIDLIWNINGVDTLFGQNEFLALAEGNYCLKFVNKDYCISYSDTISLNQGDVDFDVHLYPSITKNIVTLQYYAPENKLLQLNIYDVNGRLINKVVQSTIQGLDDFQIDLTDYSQGLYIFEIIYDQSRNIFKVMKVQN
ncbi:MAG TPA: T9SS type A sorting domain-containing protein [Candidatus Kapabacteria bacterium]|nr:T9SS type A sorting domain-containing protein [Candidatus Kapabacteria bacterium]